MTHRGDVPTAAELAAELTRATDAFDELVYVVSHDLREPLRGIHSYSAILLEDCAEMLDGPGKQKLAALMRMSARMEELLDALLDLSRAGHCGRDPVDVDMNALVSQVVEQCAARAAACDASVTTMPDLPTIRAERERMAQVFSALVENALTYSNGGPLRIEIGFRDGTNGTDGASAQASGDGRAVRPRFFVRDTGIGIAPEHQAAIFRMFKRLHARAAYGGGIGAGLTLARRIVELHGGELWVESEPGDGSTFWLTPGPLAAAPR